MLHEGDRDRYYGGILTMNAGTRQGLKRFYILASLGILLALALSISSLFLASFRQAAQGHADDLRKEIIRSKREFIQDAVNRTIQEIEQERARCAENRGGACDEEAAKIRLRESIRAIRLKDNGYIWINAVLNYGGGDNYAYRFVHPNLPKTEGMMLSTSMRDIKGNLPYRMELEGVKEHGEIFFDYWFKKKGSEHIQHKLTFAKLYRPYDWIVATGVYLDDIEGLVQAGTARWNMSIRRNVLLALALTGIAVLLAWLSYLVVGKRVDTMYSFFLNEMASGKEELAIREREFRTLAENTPDAIARYGRDGRRLYTNPAFAELIGVPPGEYLADPPDRYASMPFMIEYKERIRNVFSSGGIDECEYLWPTHGGLLVTTHVRMVPERDRDGGIASVLCVGRDITERKRMEEELHAKNAELEQFTYTVSHDLKSPLITIRSFAGSIMRDLASGRYDRIGKDLGRISAAADMMAALLDDLLRLSRIGRVVNAFEPVDMAQLVQDVLAGMAGTIEEAGVRISVLPGLPTIMCDRQRMTEVVQNLVENAVKYRGNQPEPCIEIGLREEMPGPVLFVRDNGPGIDPQYHEAIFGLFNRLDTTLPGTGIGLALVRRIIEVHGGRVWVESEGPGNGSTFCFTVGVSHD